jgi:glycosyltransferase involved in cell wall biosynthesis
MQLSDLTIVVPTKNEAHNIGRFLAGIPQGVNLIVVDASEDATPDLVLTTRPHKTNVIRHPARIAGARQIGAEAAGTSWLLFTDADVTFDVGYFDRILAYGACDALYGPKLAPGSFGAYYRWFSRGQGWLHRLGIPAASGSNLAVQRQVCLDSGGFDTDLLCNEDSEFGWRLARQGYRIVFAPDLAVLEHDHRRLRRGVVRKSVHSVTRCALLYTGLMPRRWRGLDWGYWSYR